MIRALEINDFNKGFLSLLGIMLNKEQFTEIFKIRQSFGIITLVSEIDKKIVGTASYFIEPNFDGTKTMHIINFHEELHDHLEYLAKLQGVDDIRSN